MFLSDSIFKTVIATTPLISIDLVIKNSQGQYLLGYRNNKPAKDFWFVPGGRVLKDEAIDAAFSRLVLDEIGDTLTIENAQFKGVYEHFYDDCVFGDDTSTHYIVLGYELCRDLNLHDLPEAQHSQYKWFTPAELLQSDNVHIHSKWYLPINK